MCVRAHIHTSNKEKQIFSERRQDKLHSSPEEGGKSLVLFTFFVAFKTPTYTVNSSSFTQIAHGYIYGWGEKSIVILTISVLCLQAISIA